MKRIIFLISVLIFSGCSGNPPIAGRKIEENRNTELLYLIPAKFSDNLSVSKIEKECSMLLSLTDSVLAYANDNSLNIEYREDLSEVDEDQSVLRIEYEEIIPHQWRPFAVRPSSVATVKAEIVRGSEVIDITSKRIGSGVAFGACDRLEKIAVSGGTYIAKWAANSSY
ncbi:hypothetical protein [Microbulbifer sp.]|uniref:hypothetical protein n=1 Tax=Microbulbifer sp. TaxID=1908541 RepID=UPI003F38D1A4